MKRNAPTGIFSSQTSCLSLLNPGLSAWDQHRIQPDSGRKPGMMGRATLSEQNLTNYHVYWQYNPPCFKLKSFVNSMVNGETRALKVP